MRTFGWLTPIKLHPAADWHVFIHYYGMNTKHPRSQWRCQIIPDRPNCASISYKCLKKNSTDCLVNGQAYTVWRRKCRMEVTNDGVTFQVLSGKELSV